MNTASETLTRCLKLARQEVAKSGVSPAPEIAKRRRARLAYHWIRHRIPVPWTHRLRDEQLRERVHPKLLAAVDKWRETKGNLILLGPTGAGKTTAAVLALRAYAEQLGDRLRGDRSGVAQRVYDLSDKINLVSVPEMAQEAMAHPLGSRSEPTLIRTAKRAELLVLDDLGNEGETKLLNLHDVADTRYVNRRPTIVTSGVPLPQLHTRYSDAVVRRLVETCGWAGVVGEAF